MSTNTEEKLETLATAYKALAHPHRIQIIKILLDQPLYVAEIARRLGINRTMVSRHLIVLKDAGIIDRKRSFKRNYYYIKLPKEKLKACLDLMD